MTYLLMILALVAIVLALVVAVLRSVLRINHICNRLDQIAAVIAPQAKQDAPQYPTTLS